VVDEQVIHLEDEEEGKLILAQFPVPVNRPKPVDPSGDAVLDAVFSR
jgi:hypothetical protein